MKFKPGQTGNPGGRPKAVKELLALVRQDVPEAFELARSLMRTAEDDRVRLEAAKVIISYGMGAPPKVVEDVEDTPKTAHGLTLEEMRAIARQPLASDSDEPH